MPTKTFVCLGLAIVSGCATNLLSDDRIRANTAGVLGQPASAVVISDRREEGLNTYYTARTRRGVFACSINGGNILTAGMVNAPICNRS
jgi:hypothetical protein